MDRQEIYNELYMGYHEQCSYLKEKYGEAAGNYFLSENCKTKNKKIVRTSEGLICHHIYEDRYPNISQPAYASMFPFEAQEKEALVYCNYLEHFILHLKIAAIKQRALYTEPDDRVITESLNVGITLIAADINDLYYCVDPSELSEWKRVCFKEIEDSIDDYVFLIQTYLLYVRKICLWQDQQKITFRHKNDLLSRRLNLQQLEPMDGREYLKDDLIEVIAEKLCTGKKIFYEKLYIKVKTDYNSEIDKASAHLLGFFKGYGYPEYSYYRLSSLLYGYGTNADEFISQTINTTYSSKHHYPTGVPVFWAMEKPLKILQENLPYVIAFDAQFKLKNGQQPLVIEEKRKGFQTKQRRLIMWDDEYEEFCKRYTIIGKMNISCGCYFDPELTFTVGDTISIKEGMSGQVLSIRDINNQLVVEISCLDHNEQKIFRIIVESNSDIHVINDGCK